MTYLLIAHACPLNKKTINDNLEMVDIEDEVELVMEESSELDNYEMENEATE